MPLGIKNAPAMLTSAPLLSHPDVKIPFILYANHVIFGLGAEIHQMKIINGQKINGPVCYIFEQSRYSWKNYGHPIGIPWFILGLRKATSLPGLDVVWSDNWL